MNIDINNNVKLSENAWQMNVASSEGSAKPTDLAGVKQSNGLTITHSFAAPEDIAAAEVPEDSLRRDDALGKLISGAFNLSPPPMPAELLKS